MANPKAWYDDSRGEWVFPSSYNFKKIEKKLTAHFADGGLAKNIVIAGLIGVSDATVYNWKNPKSAYYKEEFHKLLDRLKPKAYEKTDKKHRDLSFGRLKNGNASALNRRVSHLLGMVEKIETRQEIKIEPEQNIDEMNAEISEIDEALRASGVGEDDPS